MVSCGDVATTGRSPSEVAMGHGHLVVWVEGLAMASDERPLGPLRR